MIPNAENKDRTGALWLRNLNLNFFFEKKKDSHYGNQSMRQLDFDLLKSSKSGVKTQVHDEVVTDTY